MPEMTIGRGQNCTVVLDDKYASPLHARISTKPDGTVWVEDLGSTNGTWLIRADGERLKVAYPLRLHAGDQLRIGRTMLPIPAL